MLRIHFKHEHRALFFSTIVQCPSPAVNPVSLVANLGEHN